ncbi:unnamed protein product [Aphanomyces euteiches]
MCGYEFRPGDMAWNCRQCQKDETCVLCHACFSSSHADLHHDVTFYYTQQGTGCCDCGDEEAWDPAGFCAQHNPPTEATGDILSSVPSDLLDVAHQDVLQDVDILFKYALARRRGFRREISKEDTGLFDLWLHVTEANIRSAQEKLTLVQSRISAESVFHWLSTLDKSNVSLFDAGDADVYANVLAVFARLTHAALACDVGCRLVAHHMSMKPDFLGHLIRVETLLPQPEGTAMHTLIMALLPDPAFKEAFAIAYTESYAFIFEECLHGLGTQGQTILIFGVQFLNRASFVYKLMSCHGLLEVLLGALEKALLEGSIPITLPEQITTTDTIMSSHPWDILAERMLQPWTQSDLEEQVPPLVAIRIDAQQFTSHRYIQVLLDLKYVFQIPHNGFLDNYATHYRWLCRILALLQGIGAAARLQPTEPHVALESRSWIVCIELASMVEELVSALIANVVTSKHDHSSFDIILKLVQPLVDTYCTWLAISRMYFPTELQTVGAKDMPVGAHFPLHQSLFLILRACTSSPDAMNDFDVVLNQVLPHPSSEPLGAWHREMLARPMMRSLVWDAQVHIGMWKRNGWGVVNHSMNYGEPYYCMRFRDLDLLGLQYSVAMLGMDTFISRLLLEFDGASLEVPEYDEPMMAEFLKVICQLATELPLADGGSLNTPLRRVLLLRLCSKPSTHSELFKAVSEFSSVHEVHAVLNPIAYDAAVKELTKDWIMPNQKNYTLDPKHLELYDATTIHLTRKQHEAARLNRLEYRMEQFKKNSNNAAQDRTYLPAVPPPLHLSNGLLGQFEPAFYLVLHPALTPALEGIVRHMDEVPLTLSTMAVHLLTLQLYALRTALDHPVYHELGNQFLEWLPSIVPTLEELNPWTKDVPSRDTTDHERGRHIQWILHELSSYPRFHSIAYAPALASFPPSSTGSQTDSLRHRAQQMALLKMQQQQAAFSDYLDETISDDESDSQNVCAMCLAKEAGDESALCYVGFVHPSSLNVPSGHVKKTPWEDMKKEVSLTMQCCGHCVHASCWESYYAAQFQRVITGEAYLNAVDVKKGEFLCPLCKAISNVLVPIMNEPAPPLAPPNALDDFSWEQWLFAPSPPSTDALSSPLSEGLAKLCMSIHRVATGAIEKAYPERYITTACHAVFTTRWTTALTDISKDRIQPFVAAARHLRHPWLTWQLRMLLKLGHTSDERSAILDTHTLTQVQKTWISVVGMKPLLIHDLGSIVARGILLSDNYVDAACIVQLVALAFIVQTTLWLASAPTLSVPVDEAATEWFLQSWCGGVTKAQAAGSLLQILEGSIAWPENEWERLVDLVAMEVFPFCREAQTMIAQYEITWLILPELPPTLKQLIHTWICAFQNTYETMQDPQEVLAQWRLKQNILSWSPVLHQDLDTSHVPLSVIWFHHRTQYLRQLPASYNSLYLQLTKQVCPSCQLFPARPALCLICGSLLCAASSCKAITPVSVSGACTLHAHKCGRGVGLFLLVLEGTVLLVSGKLASFYGHGLYVDEYGEGFGENHSVATYRGRPLFLQTQTRDQLLRLWIQQGIPMEIVQSQNIATHIVPNSHY